MLDSYFFIPGDKERFLNKVDGLSATHIVIDLEESVALNKKQIALDLLKRIKIKDNYFVRLPINGETYSQKQLNWIVEKFNGNIVLPKIESSREIESFYSIIDKPIQLKMILLVEHPKCMVNLKSIIERHKNSLIAIGFGSHDFCASMNMKHQKEHLNFYRKTLIMYAKAYELEYIDGVDVNLNDLSVFEEECFYAYESGADGKFLIHPKQLEVLQKLKFLNDDEIKEARDLYDKISQISSDEMDVCVIGGVVYEKPHLKRIKKIIDTYDNHNN